MTESAEKMLIRIQFAEKAERFDEMVKYVKCLVQETPEWLEQHGELDLVSVAYKNAVGERRASWRVMMSLLEQSDSDDVRQEVAREFTERLEKEITTICTDLLELVTKHLEDITTSPESKVLLLKLKGDYSRYLTEIQSGNQRKESIANASTAYQEAVGIAECGISPAHPNMLGLVLNRSLFHCVILEEYAQACEIAKKCIEEAERKMDDIEEGKQDESNRILQIIKDNLKAWTSDG